MAEWKALFDLLASVDWSAALWVGGQRVFHCGLGHRLLRSERQALFTFDNRQQNVHLISDIGLGSGNGEPIRC